MLKQTILSLGRTVHRLVRQLPLGSAASRREIEHWRAIALNDISRSADARALSNAAARKILPRPALKPAAKTGNEWSPAPRAEVSVVLGTYNRLEALQLTIQSIRDNGFSRPYEIIVIDGGSTDGTIPWLSEQKDVLMLLQHNRDASRNSTRRRSWGYFMNLGFKVAEAPWILMLSDDCLLVPGSIQNSLELVGTLDAKGQRIGGVAYYFRNWPADSRYFVQHTIGGMLMVNHGLFSKQALENICFANETDYSFYKADSDLSLKLWHRGYEIAECKDAIVEHLLLPSEQLRVGNTQSLNDDRATLIERWRGIYTYPELDGLFKSPVQSFIDVNDTTRTAEKFRPLLEKDKLV